MRIRFRTLLALLLTVGAVWFVPAVPQAHANQGTATVYLLQGFCSDMLNKDFAHVGNPNDVIQGAIAAATPYGRNFNVPLVHAVGSKAQPYFYAPTYQVVNDFATYTDIVLNRIGAIVVNPCGSLLRVPDAYTWQQWIDQMANAMTQRRLTWVNVGSYPFYVVIHECACVEYPYAAGLQRLLTTVMGSTNANAVNLTPPSGLVNGGLTNAALSTLSSAGLGGWTSLNKANSINPDQVLRKSQFGQLAVLPLYGSSDNQDTYWEGAVIGFAQTNGRIVSSGSGSLIQISGLHTYDNSNPPVETINYYYQGYVSTAAALYAESNQFTPSATYQKLTSWPGERIASLKVNPTILGANNVAGQGLTVRLAFGVYGAEQVPTSVSDPMHDGTVDIENRGVSGVSMQVLPSQSRNGDGTGIEIQGLANSAPSDSWETPVSTALFLAGGFPPAAPFVTSAGAALLLYDWSKQLASSHDTTQCTGFTAPPNACPSAYFAFTPNLYGSQPDSNHVLVEFQTIIVLEVYVPTTDTDWTIFPIGYNFKLNTSTLTINAGGEVDLAVWTNNPGKTVRIFHDSFKGDVSDWSRGSANGGDDYWGLIDSTLVDEAPVMWAAAVGNNDALGGVPNIQAQCGPGGPFPPCYDINMNAFLMHDLSQLNLKAYSSVSLMFDARMQMNSGAYLKVEMGSFTQTYQGDGTDHFWQFYTLSSMPTDAQSLTFRFVSNGNTPVTHGVWIDTVDLIGTIWNDPGTGTVNGHASGDCSTATSLTPSGTYYYGYLAASTDNPQSFYQFPVNVGGQITATLGNLLPGENLNLQLYDPNCIVVGSPGTNLSTQASSNGNYRVKVYPPSGYGAYQLYLNVAGFTLSPNPATLNLNTPNSAQTSVTVTAGGSFSGTVNLAATGSLSGLTLSFNPPSVSVGVGGTASSTLTVSTSTSTATGSYTVTATGTSGSISRQTSVAVNVVQGPAPSFTYSPSHIPVGLPVSFTATASMGTPPYSFTWNAPNANPMSGSGSIFTTSFVVHGTYTVSLTVADANGLSATTSQNVVAYALPLTADFTYTPGSPGTGQTMSFNANISHGSSPYTASWTFGDGTSATGTTFPSHAYSSAGQYIVTLVATDSSNTNVMAVHCVAVGGATPCDFSTSATSTYGNAGTSLTSTITVTALNGFSGSVSLTDNPPSGLNCGAITPSSVLGQGTATVSCNSSVAGYYALPIKGTSGSLSPSTNAAFTVTDFTISATSPVAAMAGTSPVSTITISALGASPGSVSLTTTTIPQGLSCSLINPNTVTPSAIATASCYSNSAGSYTATFTGTGATLSHFTTATFTFTDFSMNVNFNSNPPINVNTAITYPASITGINGFSGTVSLSTTMYSCQSDCSDGSPPVTFWTDTGTGQTTAQPSSCPSNSCTKSLTVKANNAVGQFLLYVLATCSGCGPGAASHSTSNTFWVQCNPKAGTPPADFCTWPDLTPLSVVVNGVPGEGIYLDSNAGYSGTVTLLASITSCINSCGSGTPPTVQWNDTKTAQTNAVLDPNSSSCLAGPVWYCVKKLLIIYANTQTGEYTVNVTETCLAGSCTTAKTHTLLIDFWVSPGGGGGSVAAGTLITLADGSQVPAQNLQVGMQVLSYDMSNHQYVTSTITRYFSVVTYNQMEIYAGTGKPLIVDQNPAQKLYVQLPDGTVTLLSVTQLQAGYKLFNAVAQEWVPITALHYENGGRHVMYDIYTSDPGNYIANGILDPLKM